MKQKNNFQIQENFNEDLKILQACELENFKLFKKICDDNNLRYYMIGGTLIGVVRHNGFIPWDDDIDVAMPRDDFERLVRFIEKEKGDKYLIMDTKHYPNYPLMTTRITMRGTKFKEEALKSIDAPMGIFLYLYPLDKMSDDPKEAKKQARDAWFWSKILILRSIPFPMLGFTGWKKKVIHAICGLAHLGLKILHVPRLWIF